MDDIITLGTPTGTRRSPVEGYRNQSMRRQAQEIIDDMGGPPVKRASQSRTPQSVGTRAYLQRRSTYAPDTFQDNEIAPSTRRSIQPSQPPRRRVPFSLWIVTGMLAMAVIGLIVVQAGAWVTRTFSDPSYYTQTAHLDTTTVTDPQGNRSQVHAFIDAQGHLSLFIMPDDPSKFRVIVGSTLTNIDDPQHKAILMVTASGTTVTVTAQGQLLASWYTTYRQSAQWSVDISQKQQQ